MTLGELRSEWRRKILRIAVAHGAGRVRVFGSVVRGEAGPKSDIDFLVRMDRGRSYLDLVGLERELAELLPQGVDVVTDGGLSLHLRDRILQEAVPL